MQNKQNFLPFFTVFFTLSILIILLGKTGIVNGVISIVDRSTLPIRTVSLSVLGLSKLQNKQLNQLIQKNAELQKQLINKDELTKENKALKDQFASTKISSQDLIPAKVVGYEGLIPGTSLPSYLIIDKGTSDGIQNGSAVVSGEYLIGTLKTVNSHFSKIVLVTNKSTNFAAKVLTDSSEIDGIIKGKGTDDLVLDNVLLSQNLQKDKWVLTKGGRDETGNGFPPDLIVGKIVSIDKNPSDLFQRAAVNSPIDFSNITTVFVIK